MLDRILSNQFENYVTIERKLTTDEIQTLSQSLANNGFIQGLTRRVQGKLLIERWDKGNVFVYFERDYMLCVDNNWRVYGAR